MRRHLALLLTCAVIVAACATGTEPTTGPLPTAPTTTATAAPTPTASATTMPTAPAATPSVDLRVSGWREDIARLVPGMDLLHPNLTHGVSRAELDGAALQLAARAGSATDDELMVGVLGIVALVSKSGCDGHTGAYIWGSGTYPVDSLPLRLWLFDDGVYVVDALDPYRDMIGARITTIGGHATDEVIAAVTPLVAHDNAATIRLLMPRFLLIPQVLRGLGLIGGGSVGVGLATAQGSVERVVEPISMADYNAWAGPYGLFLPTDPALLYLSRTTEPLWWQTLDGGRTLYVQYNRVDFIPADQVATLRGDLAEPTIRRVVVDVRHNYGGELRALDPIVDTFRGAGLDAGRLFVITGRNTFSAASMFTARMVEDPGALVVGEPMGGCPTFYANTDDLLLPYSGIHVSVATTFEVGVSETDTRLTIEPDIAAPLSAAQWAAGIDPALEAIANLSGAPR